jgi:hypothetical protein
MTACMNCGKVATVIIVDPGPLLRTLCPGCFEDQGGEVPPQPLVDNVLEFHLLTEEGGEDGD